MAPRSDTRRKMIEAARDLIREQGLNATAVADVLERSGAPRGSVYFHFPGGKTELAIEGASSHADGQVALIDHLAGEARSASELVRLYVDEGRDAMVSSGYSRGCGLAPLVTEGPHDSEAIVETTARGFQSMVERMALHLAAFGMTATHAEELAHAVIAGVEGAMVTSRALTSTAPYDAVRDALLAFASTLK